jgi:hypothetical protein
MKKKYLHFHTTLNISICAEENSYTTGTGIFIENFVENIIIYAGEEKSHIDGFDKLECLIIGFSFTCLIR